MRNHVLPMLGAAAVAASLSAVGAAAGTRTVGPLVVGHGPTDPPFTVAVNPLRCYRTGMRVRVVVTGLNPTSRVTVRQRQPRYEPDLLRGVADQQGRFEGSIAARGLELHLFGVQVIDVQGTSVNGPGVASAAYLIGSQRSCGVLRH